MAETNWRVDGEYFESCNCDYVCPCLSSNMAARPTEGECKVAMAFQVKTGHYGDVSLDGLKFAVLAHTPGAMAEGNWTVGLIIDEGADAAQQEAIGAIASGAAGGPMSALGPLIGNFAGVEVKPIDFETNGMTRSVKIGDMLDQSVTGVGSAADPDEPIVLDNTLHPANARVALAKASRSHFHAFGIEWDDTSGEKNGHFAPFSWQPG